MKRILLTGALFVLSAFFCQAQDDDFVSGLKGKLENNRVLFDFRYTVNAEVPVEGSGTAILQDDCFFAVSGSTKIFCDGKSRWTLDESCHEAYVENCGSAKDFLEQPEQYLANVYDFQTSADSFKGIYADPVTGVEATFVISGILCLPKSSDKSLFLVSEETLGEGWVVTDLR